MALWKKILTLRLCSGSKWVLLALVPSQATCSVAVPCVSQVESRKPAEDKKIKAKKGNNKINKRNKILLCSSGLRKCLDQGNTD